MIVFYGWRGKVIPGKILNGHTCQNCGQASLRSITIWSYVHMFWIPMLPFERKLATECTHCQATAVGKQVPERVRESIKRQGAVAGVPKYMFSGGVALALLIGILVLRSHVQEARTAGLAADPHTGDYYVVDYEQVLGISQGDLRYGVLRINSLEEDSIAFDVGGYGYEYHSDARSAIMKGQTSDAGYFFGTQVMSRDDVRAHYDDEHVKRIVRKE